MDNKNEPKVIHNNLNQVFDEQEDNDQALNVGQLYKAYIYGTFAVIILILCLPSKVTMAFLLAFPILSVFIVYFSKGSISFFNETRNRISGVFLGVIAMLVLLWCKSISAYTILVYNSSFWFSFITISAVIGILLCYVGLIKNADNVKTQVAIFLIAATFYSYSITIQLNCTYDFSAEKVLQTTVLNHYQFNNNGTFYGLWLSPLNPRLTPLDVPVSHRVFERTYIGSTVKITLKKGLLDIPWIKILL